MGGLLSFIDANKSLTNLLPCHEFMALTVDLPSATYCYGVFIKYPLNWGRKHLFLLYSLFRNVVE